MPEIATETSPNEVRCDVTASTNDVRSVADVRITDVTKAVSALTTEVKTGDLDTSLSYDAPPFVPRSVITETKLLAAFKNQALSSSEFDSGESAGEFLLFPICFRVSHTFLPACFVHFARFAWLRLGHVLSCLDMSEKSPSYRYVGR
jgi:hypothetical protein